ncbi:hypothetical protein ACDA63_15825 [Uliginosibacterium sp. sgz301328]|uniref:hypothetical protein n=1 Tax=Uliginosibacterium sp. sgz301328 TaxID=3243764 RepID=UPI00359EE02C
MRTFTKVAAAAILGTSTLLPMAAFAHDRDHDRGRGPRYERYDRYYGGPRVVERTVVYRPAPPVVYRERIYREPVVYQEPVYVAPVVPVYGRPAVTIGVSLPPIVIPIR